jgi:hypothetical protein
MNRLLGPSEFQLWLLDRRSPYNAAVVARLAGTLPEERWRAALAAAQRRHPVLRARIEPEPRPRFAGGDVPPVPFALLPRRGPDSWRAELAALVRRPVPLERGPLAAAVALADDERTDLLLAMPHEAADGRSLLFLLRDVLAAAGEGAELAPLPEWPSCEELLPAHALADPADAELVADWWSRRTGERLQALQPASLFAGMPEVGATHAHPWELSAAASARLAAVARRHEASAHGAIVAAFLLALVEERGAGGRFRVSHPFDLRAELEPPVGEDVGLFIAPLWTEHAVAPGDDPWRVAAGATAELLAAIAGGDHFAGALAVRRSPAPNAILDRDLLDRTVTVSNLGPLPIPERYGGLAVERLYATGSITVGLPVLSSCQVGGRLAGMLNHPESWRPPAVGAAVAARLQAVLEGMAG